MKGQRAMWAFWIAAALAAIGAVAPLSFSIGAHSRLQWAIVPFGIAAVVLGINAVMYHQSRSLAATLYFVAGLAIVYGILAMVAVPLRLAVVGTCPPAPATCPLGYEQPMTSAENSGLALASFCGVLAIFVGFYGLLMLYRPVAGQASGPDDTAGGGRARGGSAGGGRAGGSRAGRGCAGSGRGSSGRGSPGRGCAGPGRASRPQAARPAPSQSQATGGGRAQGAPGT